MKKNWLSLLVIPAATFGVTFLSDILMKYLSDFSGLLIMGMLLLGWPGISAWLGMMAGKDLRTGWYLPILYALAIPFVFPYYGAGWIAWAYAGLVLVIGLINMICTKLTE